MRLISVDDAEAIHQLRVTDYDFLAPWEPFTERSALTLRSQREQIERIVAGHHNDGGIFPYVILAGGEVIGQITLSHIVRHNFQSGNLGYWVSEAHNGRGHATAAVGQMVRLAFDELGLNRVEASTLLGNIRSQKVLARNDFTRIGLAPNYLKIADRWSDSILFQRVTEHQI